jgi:hypothetical protein
MRTFRKIFVIAVILTVILLIAATFLARVFEEELARYAVEGLSRQIRTEVNVEEVKLSFIKKFPDASLEFRNVVFASVKDHEKTATVDRETDTLLAVENLFLRFNIIELLKRRYIVKEVQLQSGKLNIIIDREGTGNYRFWKEPEARGEKDFLLELDNVKLAGMHIRYDNRALGIYAEGMVRKSYFRGQFSRETYSISSGIEGKIIHYSNRGTEFIRDREISSTASLKVDPQSIEILEGNLKLAGQHLLVTGNILRPKPLDFNLSFKGKRLDLENILRHVRIHSRKFPEDLKAGGILDLKGELKGTVSNTDPPGIRATFSLREGWMRSSRFLRDFDEIKTQGSYTNGIRNGPETTRIELDGVSMKFGNSRLGGEYSVYNLVSPDFSYNIKADIDLPDLETFFTVDSLMERIQGRILAEIRMEGDQALLGDFKKQDLLKYRYDAKFSLEDVSLKFRNLPFEFKDFTGEAVVTDHLEVRNLSGDFEDSRFNLSGRVDNFLEYLLTQGGNLWMDMDIYSEKVDLNHLRNLQAEGKPNEHEDTVNLPGRLYLKARFWLDEFEISNFTARQVTGDLIYKPRRLSVNHIELLSMDGRVSSGGILEQQQDMQFLVKSISEISSVDITSAFASFDDFGQEFILGHHIKGTLSGEVNFSARLNERMKIQKESILSDCDVIIRNGELTGFEPMMKLSKYIDVEELENISFSTLTNEIFIRNEEVVIPNMDIQSSAFTIKASGLHGFDRYFTYKVKAGLSEILAKKSSRPLKEESEFGPIEDDGLGRVYVYLIIEGTPQTIEVRYDRRGAVQNVREQLREEKQELKQILRNEFGLFKKDSSLVDTPRQKQPDFMIDWEETSDSTAETEKKKSNNSGEERFIIIWDDEEEQDISTPEPEKKRRRKQY